MPGVEIVFCTNRNDGLWLERPRPGELFCPRTLNLLVAVLEADHEQAITTVNLRCLIRMVWVHHEERLVESAHRLRICDRQRTFQFPSSRPEIILVGANSLCVPRRIVKQHHSPALNRLIPDDARIAAHASVASLPFQHDAAPCPGTRNREAFARFPGLR